MGVAIVKMTAKTLILVVAVSNFVFPNNYFFFRVNGFSSTPIAGSSRSKAFNGIHDDNKLTIVNAEDGVSGDSTGPKSSESSIRRRTSRDSSTNRNRSAAAGPRAASVRSTTRRTTTTSSTPRRAPHQFDHKKADARPFINAKTEVQLQESNENASPYDFLDSNECNMKCISTDELIEGKLITHEHFQYLSLDDLFPNLGFSKLFSASKEFRTALRNSMRADIFDSTPSYAGMSEKARKMLLLPDSSLQGSWRCCANGEMSDDSSSSKLRMVKLTNVLQKYLGSSSSKDDDSTSAHVPTGDEFMETIGKLCGSNPTTHWIDIIGITDRKISHSWHQDTGRNIDGDTKTVLFAFPLEDNYIGTGVFTHVIKLSKEQFAPNDHPINEPLVYSGTVDEKYIVRPKFEIGKELIIYRDIDVLHSAPDVAYRASVMRFM